MVSQNIMQDNVFDSDILTYKSEAMFTDDG